MIRFTPVYFSNRNFDCGDIIKIANKNIKIGIGKNVKFLINFKWNLFYVILHVPLPFGDAIHIDLF